jgi:hypothetical protein
MTLTEFLTTNAPLTAIEVLPDNRLINVVIGDGMLFGVENELIVGNVSVTRHLATLTNTTIVADTLTFDTDAYTMLGMSEI